MPRRPDQRGVCDPPERGGRDGPSRRRVLAGLGALAAGALAGCAGAPDGGPATGDTPTRTPLATDAQRRFPGFEWSRLEDAEPVATDTVVMRDLDFEPLVATVSPGTEVTVVNEDSAGHELSIPRLGVDAVLDGGESISFTVEQAGTYDYVCEYHPPDMLGRLLVEK